MHLEEAKWRGGDLSRYISAFFGDGIKEELIIYSRCNQFSHQQLATVKHGYTGRSIGAIVPSRENIYYWKLL